MMFWALSDHCMRLYCLRTNFSQKFIFWAENAISDPQKILQALWDLCIVFESSFLKNLYIELKMLFWASKRCFKLSQTPISGYIAFKWSFLKNAYLVLKMVFRALKRCFKLTSQSEILKLYCLEITFSPKLIFWAHNTISCLKMMFWVLSDHSMRLCCLRTKFSQKFIFRAQNASWLLSVF